MVGESKYYICYASTNVRANFTRMKRQRQALNDREWNVIDTEQKRAPTVHISHSLFIKCIASPNVSKSMSKHNLFFLGIFRFMEISNPWTMFYSMRCLKIGGVLLSQRLSSVPSSQFFSLFRTAYSSRRCRFETN